ncbi:MAG: hypothetical protein SGJ09_14205 [Phycisphaerae bacterium]|nr:hypothetical protein [Phycisphaerae bacterium]
MKHPIPSRMLSIALGASLLFNVAVLFGFAASSSAPATPSTPAPRLPADPAGGTLAGLGKELNLDEGQRSKLAAIEGQREESVDVFGGGSAVIQQRLIDALGEEQPDISQIHDLVNQQAELDRQRRLADADLLERFFRLLTPPQRNRLHQKLKEKLGGEPGGRHPGGPPLAVLRRFDTNRDGRLDSAERHAAEIALQIKQGELFRGGLSRPPIWPWFDADGDGRLNDDERAERDRFVQAHPPRRGPGREGEGRERPPESR